MNGAIVFLFVSLVGLFAVTFDVVYSSAHRANQIEQQAQRPIIINYECTKEQSK